MAGRPSPWPGNCRPRWWAKRKFSPVRPSRNFAGDRFARSEADGVHEAIQAVPTLGQVGEQVGDLLVAGHVAVEGQLAAEFGSEFSDAVFEALANKRLT
jgi:hypothetical protein